MNVYRDFAADLNQLLGGQSAVRITVPDYMPLCVEEIGTDEEGHRLVSLCHYGKQNGDLMRDPDIVFMFQPTVNGSIAEPVSFRNDYLGIHQDVYQYNQAGKRTHVFAKRKTELKEFAQAWFANLKDQEFFRERADRTILSP